MDILTIAGDLVPIGGLDRSQLDICRALAKRGHRITLLYQRAGPWLSEWGAFCATMCQVPTVDLINREGVRSSLIPFIRAVARGVSWRGEVIYAHHFRHMELASALSTVKRRPMVVHLHNRAPVSAGRIRRKLFDRTAAFIAVSRSNAERWFSLGVDPAKTTVVHNGVDLSRFQPASAEERTAARRELGLPPDSPIALFAGRITPGKGIEVLLDAWEQFQPRKVATLVVVGTTSFDLPDQEAAHYLAQLKSSVGGQQAIWMEHRADIRPLLRASDLMLVPSVEHDQCPLSLIEGLACHLPVVGSKIGGIPELLTDELAELLVAPGDSESLAETVDKFIDWRVHRPSLAEASARRSQSLSLEVTAQGVERVLTRIGSR